MPSVSGTFKPLEQPNSREFLGLHRRAKQKEAEQQKQNKA